MSSKKFYCFRVKVIKFIVQDQTLFKQAEKNQSVLQVVNNLNKQQRIKKTMHEKLSHQK